MAPVRSSMRIGHSGAARPETDGRIMNARSMIFSAAARLAGAMVSGCRGQYRSPADPPSRPQAQSVREVGKLAFTFCKMTASGQREFLFSSQGRSSENSTMFGDASAGEEQPACGATESQRRGLRICDPACMNGGCRLASVWFGRGQAAPAGWRSAVSAGASWLRANSQRARASILRQDCALCTTPAWDLAVCWTGVLPLLGPGPGPLTCAGRPGGSTSVTSLGAVWG